MGLLARFEEGHAAAALIPGAVALDIRNGLHETAIADEGQFPSPSGEDLAGCVGPIVRRFLATDGRAGDTSCIARIRPIRTVPAFARSWTTVAPATSAPGDAVGPVLKVTRMVSAPTTGASGPSGRYRAARGGRRRPTLA